MDWMRLSSNAQPIRIEVMDFAIEKEATIALSSYLLKYFSYLMVSLCMTRKATVSLSSRYWSNGNSVSSILKLPIVLCRFAGVNKKGEELLLIFRSGNIL